MKRIILSIVAIIMGAFIAFGPPSYYIFTNDSQAATSLEEQKSKKEKEYKKQKKLCDEGTPNMQSTVDACKSAEKLKQDIADLNKKISSSKSSSSNSSDFKKIANTWAAGVSKAVENVAKKTGGNSSSSSSSSSSSGSVSVPATSDSNAVGSTTDADTPEASPEISSEAAYSGSENEGCVKTAIIGGGEVCDDGSGSSIYQILNLIVDIMTIGVGILGVVGISVAGIMYLTAGDKEDQTKKAKRRLLEIVIGLVLYVVAYALLKWLLPGFNGTGGV